MAVTSLYLILPHSSINLQIDLAALDSLLVNQAKTLFDSTCLPQNVSSSFFLDGVDVRGLSRSIQTNRVVFTITAEALVTTQAFLDVSVGQDGGPEDDVFTITLVIERQEIDIPQPPPLTTRKGLSLSCTSITAPSPDV